MICVAPAHHFRVDEIALCCSNGETRVSGRGGDDRVRLRRALEQTAPVSKSIPPGQASVPKSIGLREEAKSRKGASTPGPSALFERDVADDAIVEGQAQRVIADHVDGGDSQKPRNFVHRFDVRGRVASGGAQRAQRHEPLVKIDPLP